MGALLGIAIQLSLMAIGLTITLAVWTMRLALMVLGTVIALTRLAVRPRHHRRPTS
ncbi:MAG: hypothetical protein WB507_02515 [Solirubrobacterales bacterium]